MTTVLDRRLGTCGQVSNLLLHRQALEVLDAVVGVLLGRDQHLFAFLFHLEQFFLLYLHLRGHLLVPSLGFEIMRSHIRQLFQLSLHLCTVNIVGSTVRKDQLVLQ